MDQMAKTSYHTVWILSRHRSKTDQLAILLVRNDRGVVFCDIVDNVLTIFYTSQKQWEELVLYW